MFLYRSRIKLRGFTLAELLVTVGIISILAGLFTTGASWLRARAEEAEVVSRASHLDQALELYYIKHRKYPGAYPAQLSVRLAPYLEEDLGGSVDNPEAFVTPAYRAEGAEPLNRSYAPPSRATAPHRYVLAIQPKRAAARTAVLFAGHIVELVETLPMQYGAVALAPADVVEGGVVTFSTGTTLSLGASTMVRAVRSFKAEDGAVFHIVKLPRHRPGFLRADVVGSDVVQVVTGAGTVCVRNGVADIDVIPVALEGSNDEDDAGDDPIESTVDPPPEETGPPPRGLGDFALFSATSLQCGGNSTIDHLIGSNSNITLGAECDARGIVGGGSLTTGANLTAEGDVIVNGAVTLGGNTEITGDVDVSEGATLEGVSVGGNVTAAGSVTLRNATIRGNLAAGGNVQGNANFCVHGDVSANGDLALQSNAQIYGNAEYTGSLDARPKQILGTTEQVDVVDPSPEQYSPYELPPAATFTAGSQDVSVSSNATLDLPPGHYGALTLGGGAEITFAAGQYYFESITAQGNVGLALEVDDDEGIEIFVAGDVALDGTVETQIQGSGTAANVYLEAHGDFEISGNTTWHGTIYVPNGQASLGGNSTLYGACYASGEIDLGHHATVYYTRSERGIGGDRIYDDDDGGGGGDGGSGDGDGGGDGSSGGGDSVIETHVRVSNHSAQALVDAKVVGRGFDIPPITRRQGQGTGNDSGRSLGHGTSPGIGKWVDVVEF